eukprot:9604-Heterococcus_DN1.PRE.15
MFPTPPPYTIQYYVHLIPTPRAVVVNDNDVCTPCTTVFHTPPQYTIHYWCTIEPNPRVAVAIDNDVCTPYTSIYTLYTPCFIYHRSIPYTTGVQLSQIQVVVAIDKTVCT